MSNHYENGEAGRYPSLTFGRDIAPDDLDAINWHRIQEFGRYNPIIIDPGNEEWDKPYFLLRDHGELKAFARLHDVEVAFKGTSFNILGIATVIATDKGHGYGSQLMQEMKRYIYDSGRSAVGFCAPETAGFYRKNDFKFLDNGEGLFTFYNESLEVVEPPNPGDEVFYLSGGDGFIDEVTADPTQPIMAFRLAW